MKLTGVKKRLLAEGWTQTMIASATGRSKYEISLVLNGHRHTPSVQKDIARAVGISVEELFGEWAWFKQSPKKGDRRVGIQNPDRPFEILLVEDNTGDVRLMQEALKESRISCNLNVVGDGVEALFFLRREGKYAGSPHPDIILLDLNMPRKNGREVLEEIKNDDNLKHIPVLVLTVSKAEEDVLKAYNLHANCYITKPVELNEFMEVVKYIENFWLRITRLPQVDTSRRVAFNSGG